MGIFVTGTTANRTRGGSNFDQQTVNNVWNKAPLCPGADPRYTRLDTCGAIIERLQYGDTTANGTGWEIDHIRPVSAGGTDDLANLQPLQWQNNRNKGDTWPTIPGAYCIIRARK